MPGQISDLFSSEQPATRFESLALNIWFILARQALITSTVRSESSIFKNSNIELYPPSDLRNTPATVLPSLPTQCQYLHDLCCYLSRIHPTNVLECPSYQHLQIQASIYLGLFSEDYWRDQMCVELYTTFATLIWRVRISPFKSGWRHDFARRSTFCHACCNFRNQTSRLCNISHNYLFWQALHNLNMQ